MQNKIRKVSYHGHNIAPVSIDVFLCDMAIEAK